MAGAFALDMFLLEECAALVAAESPEGVAVA